MTRSPRAYIGVAATIAFFAIGWWLLGPSQLGGPTSYAVLSGTSMEPHLERGDLVLTRSKPSYSVGEVVPFGPSTCTVGLTESPSTFSSPTMNTLNHSWSSLSRRPSV